MSGESIKPIGRPRLGRPPLLRAEEVVKAALEIADADGFDALTLRRLGERLGVSAMTIYSYFPNRDAICEAVVESVLASADQPVDRDAPISVLRHGTEEMRRTMHAHPNVFRYLLSNANASNAVWRRLDSMLRLLDLAGVTRRHAEQWALQYTAFVNGFIAQELGTLHARPALDNDPSFRHRYPRWAQVVETADIAADANFAAGLDALLESLQPHLDQVPRARPRERPKVRSRSGPIKPRPPG